MTNTRKILIVGDSHAKGRLPDGTDSDAIAVWLGTPPALRCAVSGSTAGQWADDLDGRLTHANILVQKADAVLISLGGNDLFKAAADGSVDDVEIAELCANLSHVLEEIAVPAKRTFLLLYGYPFKELDAHKLVAVTRLDAYIASVARAVARIFRIKIETVDERLVLLPQDWPGDDIHPFRSGYERIGDEILRRLSS